MGSMTTPASRVAPPGDDVLGGRPAAQMCPHGLRVVVTPLAVPTSDDREVQSDVLLAAVAGDQPYVAREPFPLTVVPARLLDRTRP